VGTVGIAAESYANGMPKSDRVNAQVKFVIEPACESAAKLWEATHRSGSRSKSTEIAWENGSLPNSAVRDRGHQILKPHNSKEGIRFLLSSSLKLPEFGYLLTFCHQRFERRPPDV